MHPSNSKTKGKQNTLKADIVIVGGSLTGQLLSLVLKDKFKVYLIDPKLPTEQITQKGGRALALSAASLDYLTQMGFSKTRDELLNELNHQSLFSPIYELNISQFKEKFSVHLSAKNYDLPFLGVCVGANHLINLLLKKNQFFLKENWIEDQLLSYDPTINKVKLKLKSGQKIDTDLVILASGNQTITRAKNKAHQFIIKSNLSHCSALVGSVDLKLNQKAYQKYSKNGVYALLPLSQDQAAWIYSFNDEQKAHLEPIFQSHSNYQLTKQAQEKIIKQFCEIYPTLFQSVDSGAMNFGGLWPITEVFSKKIYQYRTLLIGASAVSFSPIAAQGFNLTIKDTFELALALKDKKIEIEKLLEFAIKVEQNHRKIQLFMSSLEQLAYRKKIKNDFIVSKLIQSALFSLNISMIQKQFIKYFVHLNTKD